MRIPSNSLIAILLLSIVCPLQIPYVNSQNFSTTIFTITSTQTNTSTSYSASSISFSYTLSGTATINDYVNGRIGSCYLNWYFFNSTASTTHVSYSAGERVTLYILKYSEWAEWMYSSDPCNPKPATYQSTASSTGNFDANLPPSGNSYLLVVVASSATKPSITITLGPASVASRTTVATTVPLVSIRTDTLVVTFSSITEAKPYDAWMLTGALIAVAAIGLVVFITRKSRISRRRPMRKARIARRRKRNGHDKS